MHLSSVTSTWNYDKRKKKNILHFDEYQWNSSNVSFDFSKQFVTSMEFEKNKVSWVHLWAICVSCNEHNLQRIKRMSASEWSIAKKSSKKKREEDREWAKHPSIELIQTRRKWIRFSVFFFFLSILFILRCIRIGWLDSARATGASDEISIGEWACKIAMIVSVIRSMCNCMCRNSICSD